MKLIRPGMSKRRARIIKTLSICAVFTLLSSLLFSTWYSMTSGYSAVVDLDQVEMIQLEPKKDSDTLAVMHTTAGDMTYILYPQEAPQTVQSFIELAESGYYNGTVVFRVEKDVFFAAGAPNADGSLNPGDADKPSENIPRELSPKLWPLRGALCALTSRADAGFFRTLFGKQRYYSGSRFLVADTVEMTQEMEEGLRSSEKMKIVADAFLEKGGIPNYSQQIAVFGQLCEGFDILDSITGADLTGEEGAMRPKEDIIITAIDIIKP